MEIRADSQSVYKAKPEGVVVLVPMHGGEKRAMSKPGAKYVTSYDMFDGSIAFQNMKGRGSASRIMVNHVDTATGSQGNTGKHRPFDDHPTFNQHVAAEFRRCITNATIFNFFYSPWSSIQIGAFGYNRLYSFQRVEYTWRIVVGLLGK
jgi:hypothetical protein